MLFRSISRAGVLARRGDAVEALGATTVLCTDKTGTLTQNRMSIAELRSTEGTIFRVEPEAGAPSAALRDLLDRGVLASARHPHDPMETAFHDLASAWGQTPDGAAELVHEWGLTPERLAVTRLWRFADGRRLAAAKGAPEAIADLCQIGRAHV